MTHFSSLFMTCFRRCATSRKAVVVFAFPCLMFGLFLGCDRPPNGTGAPTVTSFSPTSGTGDPSSNSATTITVVGSGFFSGVNSVAIGASNVPLTTVNFLSNTTLSFPVPTDAITGPIIVNTIYGSAVSTASLIVVPSIDSTSPITGSTSQGTTVTVSGYGLDGITTITIGTTVVIPAVQNQNQIIFNLPTGFPTGATDIAFEVNTTFGLNLPNILVPFTVTE